MAQFAFYPRRALRLGIVLLTLTCSCAYGQSDEELQRFLANKDPVLQPYFRKLYVEGEHNAVLNYDELAVAAFYSKHYSVAERALDAAIERVESIVVNDSNAEKAKRTYEKESVKNFKGEPYERAMIYYYRALLFLRAGDFQNARAAFLSAGFQDSFSEAETFAKSFAMMSLLAGWSSSCDGDSVRAKELYEDAIKQDATIASAIPLPRDIAILEAGAGPKKTTAGKHNEVLTFAEADAKDTRIVNVAVVEASDRSQQVASASPIAIGNTYMQATTRGGRPIQGVLDGKALYKDVAEDVATFAQIGSAASLAASANTNNVHTSMGFGYAGAALAIISLVANIAAAATTPEADIRGWTNLPKTIVVAKLQDLPGRSFGVLATATVGEENRVIGTRVLTEQPTCTVVWGRAASPLRTLDQLPSDKGKPSANGDGDKAFRATLLASFQEKP